MIKEIKIGDSVYSGIDAKTTDEKGNVTWNVPEELEKFKEAALDTINYQAGASVMEMAGGNSGLSAMNAKTQAIIVKLLSPSKTKLDTLTKNEKETWGVMAALSQAGYGDSERLVAGVQSVAAAVKSATEKSVRIMQATTHDEVIVVLNEE